METDTRQAEPRQAIMATRKVGRTVIAIGTEEIMVGGTVTAIGIDTTIGTKEIMVGGTVTVTVTGIGIGENMVGKARTAVGMEEITVGRAITPMVPLIPPGEMVIITAGKATATMAGGGITPMETDPRQAEPRQAGAPTPGIPRAKATAAMAGTEIPL